MAVCILDMQRLSVILDTSSNKAPFLKKTSFVPKSLVWAVSVGPSLCDRGTYLYYEGVASFSGWRRGHIYLGTTQGLWYETLYWKRFSSARSRSCVTMGVELQGISRTWEFGVLGTNTRGLLIGQLRPVPPGCDGKAGSQPPAEIFCLLWVPCI
jgi:hypothetical protein